MARRLQCPRCGSRKYWVLSDGRRRCARCRLDWRPGRLPLRLTPRQWRAIVGWFVRDAPADAIARETGVHRKRVLRALTLVRSAMSRSLQAAEGSGIEGAAPMLPPTALPVVALRLASPTPVAEVVPGLDRTRLGRRVRPARELAAEFPALQPYVAFIWRGQLRWLRDVSATERGEIGAFWAYLRRQLTARGGRRRARLGLFLAEFSWRYRFRKLEPDVQVQQLLKLTGGGEVSRMGLSPGAESERRSRAARQSPGNSRGVNR